MGNVVKFPEKISKEYIYNEIVEKYKDLMTEDFDKKLFELVKKYPRFYPKRLKNLCLVKELLVTSVDGIKDIEWGMGNVLANMCYIRLKGNHFDIIDLERYKDAMMLCSCCDAHALIDGSLEFDYTLYDMADDTDWESGIRMLFEDIFE